MKNIIFILLALSITLQVQAQTASDAILYSRTELGGTARFVGVGGAFGALGADFSALSSNPAGLAMYRSSELIFTPSMQLKTSTATIDNQSFADEKNKFHFDNLGLVFYKRPRSSDWNTFNVGIGFNQLANFNQAVYYDGQAPGSIVNSFYEDASSVNFDQTQFYPFTSGLAVNTNALYLDNNGIYATDFTGNEDALIRHQQSYTVKGRINEMVLSFAGNYEEQIMIGGTIGFPFVKYERNSSYIESDDNNAVEYFDNLIHTDFLETEGIGFNAKLGLIYRLNQMLRFGATIHTPTFLSLTDNYNTNLAYSYTDGNGPQTRTLTDDQIPRGTIDYNLRTPWKAIFSGSALFGKNGFVSADIEVIDYSNNRYNFTNNINSAENAAIEQEVNGEISQAYGQTVNIRLGGEVTADILRFRAGVALIGQPNAGETAFDRSFSTGIGLRGENAYLDLGIRFNRDKQTLVPYDVTQNQLNVNTNVKSTDLVLTVGLKF